MTTKRRMPPLTMDEVILLVDTYFCLQEVENKDTKEEMIVELSNGMPFAMRHRSCCVI